MKKWLVDESIAYDEVKILHCFEDEDGMPRTDEDMGAAETGKM